MAQLIGSKPAVVEFLACGDQVENDSRQFMGSGGDRFGCAEFGSHAPVEITQGALTVVERLGGHTKGGGGPALDLPRPDPQNFTAADVVVRTKAHPGGKRRSTPKLCEVR